MPSAACTVVRVVNCPMILTLIGAEVGQMLVVLGTGCGAPGARGGRGGGGAGGGGVGGGGWAEQEERERDECDHPTHGRASLLHVRPPATCDPGRCGSR